RALPGVAQPGQPALEDLGRRVGLGDPAVAERADAREVARMQPAGEPDRDPRLHRARRAPDPLERDRPGAEARRGPAPERAAGADRVGEELAAALPVDAGRDELLALPAGPDADLDAAAGERVERGEGLREQRRRPH